jgi:PadR family transcriptional regulator, regulatory protein PadR
MPERGPVRRSRTMTAVAEMLVAEPESEHYGYELCQATGIKSGSMFPILARFQQYGWLTTRWQDSADARPRPPRRYYRLTAEGRRALPNLITRGRRLRWAAPIRTRGGTTAAGRRSS